ncbi:MAG: glycosyltransferase family 2 protein [Collinsella aerofaciens]
MFKRGSMPYICVFTPTYNRSGYLRRIFDCLTRQSFDDFEWLIVDDGSTDDTKEVVENFSNIASFPIRYIYQENGGKQRATNLAVDLCNCPIFFGLDSDDWLVENALEVVAHYFRSIWNDDDIAGIIALRGSEVDLPLGTWMPSGLSEVNVWDLYYEYGFKGDAAQIYKTNILKRYPYPVVEGEQFISEGIVSYSIAQHYKMSLVNQVLVLGTYQEGGLTDNSYSLIRQNPLGYILVKELSLNMSKHFVQKCYQMTLLLAAYRIAHKKGHFRSCEHRFLAILCYIPSRFAFYLLMRDGKH